MKWAVAVEGLVRITGRREVFGDSDVFGQRGGPDRASDEDVPWA
jgi:hypothetical protein